MSHPCVQVLGAVVAERLRQHRRWGVQHHPTGCGRTEENLHDEAARRSEYEALARTGGITWRAVLAEEVAELFAAGTPQQQYLEAVQVAAVAMAMAESILAGLAIKGGSND
jgi:hypothetical protein